MTEQERWIEFCKITLDKNIQCLSDTVGKEKWVDENYYVIDFRPSNLSAVLEAVRGWCDRTLESDMSCHAFIMHYIPGIGYGAELNLEGDYTAMKFGEDLCVALRDAVLQAKEKMK